MNTQGCFVIITLWIYSAEGNPGANMASIKEKTILLDSGRHVLILNSSRLNVYTDSSGNEYCLEKHKGILSHINNTNQLKFIKGFLTTMKNNWKLSNINIRISGNKCVSVNTADVNSKARLVNCPSDTNVILCQSPPATEKRYYVAVGRNKCPLDTTKVATGGVFMGAKQCDVVGGTYLGSPTENQLVQCSLDWCGTDSPTTGLVMAAKNRCPTRPIHNIAARLYRGTCDALKGLAENRGTTKWQWTQCFFDWCEGSQLNKDTYIFAGKAQCAPGTKAGQALISTTAAECTIIKGNMFGNYKDWQRIDCILDLCRIGKDCKKTVLGTEYNGTVSTTISGRTCTRWDSVPHYQLAPGSPPNFPEDDIANAKNFCRNPDGWAEGPYCFTSDPQTPWQVCDIPLCKGIDVTPTSFTIGFTKYIFEPALHNNIQNWCLSKYGADLVYMDTEEKLHKISEGLKTLEEVYKLKQQEIWVAGSTHLENNHKVTDMSVVKPDGVEDRCLYLSNWNSSTGTYGGSEFNLYSYVCSPFRKRFLCESIEVRYPGYKLDGGKIQKDITEEIACKVSCTRSCLAAEFNLVTKQCIHHYKKTACRPGKATLPFKNWIHIRKHHCDCNTLLVNGPDGVSDDQITVSNNLAQNSSYQSVRLGKEGRISTDIPSYKYIQTQTGSRPWIQVDFGQIRYLYAVVTQGSSLGWVTTYKIQYFTHQWTMHKEKKISKVFKGNTNEDRWVINGFPHPIITNSVRLILFKWYQQPAMKLDFIGCLAKRENLALLKPTFQSSVASGGYSRRAVDGFIFTDFKLGSCSQTRSETFPWFAVDLGYIYHIDEVTWTSRRTCCGGRQLAITAFVSYEFGASTFIQTRNLKACGHLQGSVTGGSTAIIHCTHNTIGRFVILKSTKGKYPMTSCEVQVFGRKENSTNLALHRPAYQSGQTNIFALPTNAVDGRTHSDFSRDSCIKTTKQKDPWWVVQLDDDYIVSHVTVTNRGDDRGSLLHDFKVLVGYAFDWGLLGGGPMLDDFLLCKEVKGPKLDGETMRITCDQEVMGRYVAIMIPGASEVLSLCEVQVFGDKAPVTTFGGSDGVSQCTFPFYYNETSHISCINADKDHPWCATTKNFTEDQRWGYCQDVRLIQGRHKAEGIVTFQRGQSWYAICDDMWDDTDAVVVCRQLGFSDGVAAFPPVFPQGGGVYSFSEVQCQGNETGLSWCPHNSKSDRILCRKGEEAGVICKHRLPENGILLGFPAIERQHLSKWTGGIVLLNEVVIKHHCHITSFSYFSKHPWCLFSIQIWRPTVEQDTFVFVAEQVQLTPGGLNEIELGNSRSLALHPGDMIGIEFRGMNPIPFDYSYNCRDTGFLYYLKKSPSTEHDIPYRFLKKTERNNICRYYSVSFHARIINTPKLHDFAFENKMYSIDVQPSTKEISSAICHRKMGQNGTVLSIDSLSEQTELCSWLSEIGANGSFWLSPRSNDLTNNGRSFTYWKHCEPEIGRECVVMNVLPDQMCEWKTEACQAKSQTICQLTTEPAMPVPSDSQTVIPSAVKGSHGKMPVYYVLTVCLVVVFVAVALAIVCFLRKKSGTAHYETEPMVRFSFDNNEDDIEPYKGLENPSYSLATPYNDYQELPVKQVSEDTTEKIEDVCDARADCYVANSLVDEATVANLVVKEEPELVQSSMTINKPDRSE